MRRPALRRQHGWRLPLLLSLLMVLACGLAAAPSRSLAADAPAAASPGCDGTRDIPLVLRSASADAQTAPQVTAVEVPDRLPLALRGERARIRYQIDVSACANVPAAALWVFRVGAPYRVQADGVSLPLLSANQRARTGAEPPGEAQAYNGRIPALFALPPGTQHVVLELLGPTYMASGLVRASAGPTNVLLPQHTDAVRNVVGFAEAASGVVLVVGMMALLLWLSRRRDASLLWLAAACGLWGWRGLIYYDNTVPGRPLLFEQLNAVNALLAATMITAAVLPRLRQDPRRPLRVVAGMTALVLASFVVAELAGRGALLARSLAQGAGIGMIVWLGVEIWRHRAGLARRHLAALLGCLLALLGTVAHDLMVVAGVLPPTSNAYVFWGFVTVLVGFALMSGEYVVMTLNRAERSNEELEQRVAAKSEELERSYAQLRQTEINNARELARSQEREHLMREMHDGIGAQLMTALRGVERGALSREQLAQSLQEGLDELRLLMDSTDLRRALPDALAAWRNRWDVRLAAAGVHLSWDIDSSLDGIGLGSEASMQVMRILQEATTNVVKHSGASGMRLRAWWSPTPTQDAGPGTRALHIEVSDNGRGLAGGDLGHPGSRGLNNMRHRARQIGASFSVTNQAPPAQGCCVRLVVPLP